MNDFSIVAAPGAYIADTVPVLGKLPPSLHWWKSSILPLQQRQARLWMKFWNDLKAKMEKGKAPECFVKQLIESEYQKHDISELQAAFVAGCK